MPLASAPIDRLIWLAAISGAVIVCIVVVGDVKRLSLAYCVVRTSFAATLSSRSTLKVGVATDEAEVQARIGARGPDEPPPSTSPAANSQRLIPSPSIRSRKRSTWASLQMAQRSEGLDRRHHSKRARGRSQTSHFSKLLCPLTKPQ